MSREERGQLRGASMSPESKCAVCVSTLPKLGRTRRISPGNCLRGESMRGPFHNHKRLNLPCCLAEDLLS